MPRVPGPEDQIRAILGGRAFQFAHACMSEGESIDDHRFRDFITVSEGDVYAYVLEHGFDEATVSERQAHPILADDKTCIISEPDGRWRVFYQERGQRSGEEVLPSLADARENVVHRLFVSARVSLNHRFKYSHPELDLPLPSEMD